MAEKTTAALKEGLSVILCVGETLAEREANQTAEVVKAQLTPVTQLLKPEDWKSVPFAWRHDLQTISNRNSFGISNAERL